MSTSRTGALLDWVELVVIGRIAKSQGRNGEVAVNSYTDQPERFADLSRVFVEGDRGEPVSLTVEAVRMHKHRPVVKFAGISTIGNAAALSGRELRIPESELMKLPHGSFYHHDIVGSCVVDRVHGVLGTAERVLSTGGTDVLVIRSSDGEELLVPFCAEICRRIDLDARRIEVELPAGMLELNAN